MSVRNRRTGRWECYNSLYGDMVDCHREDEKPENYIAALKWARKYCGACDASDCDHLIAGGVHYERLGRDGVNRPAFTDHEIEDAEEEEEEERQPMYNDDGTPYDDDANRRTRVREENPRTRGPRPVMSHRDRTR